jgi:hypothetical protein
VIVSAVACSCDSSELELTPYAWSADTLAVNAELLQDLTDTVRRRDTIHRAFQIRATSGYIFVSDVGSDRIAVLDSLATVLRWIGGRGRGPGEFRGASHLAVRSDRLFVAEALNGRVSEFLLDGRFVTVYRAPFAAGSLTASSEDLFIASRSDETFASRLRRGDDPEAVMRRARRNVPSNTERWFALPGHDLLAADSGGVWVFDQGRGDVCFYATQGARPACRALPVALHLRLHQYRAVRVARFESGTGQHVNAAPLAKDMLRVGPWLAFLLPLPEMPIALLDVTDGSVTPALTFRDTMPSWVSGATSFAFDGRRFLLAGDDGIGRLNLSTHTPFR